MALGGGLVAAAATRWSLPYLLRARPIRSIEELSPEARALVERAFDGVDRTKLWDSHTHVVGLGSGGTGCWVNPDMQSHWHPIQRLQFDLYLAASGVSDRTVADGVYLERLLALHRSANPSGKLMLLAFDYAVDERGAELPALSSFHTPDDYVLRLAQEHADVLPVASVHPYRQDAPERLARAAEAGAVAIKWLPNAMVIDPASRLCDPFYAKLAELDLPLITHAGIEKAVHAEENQRLGNPLRLRRALDAGVRVVVAHCASLGESLDLDAGKDGPLVSNFELFLRLMREPQYEQNLFGEISAMTLSNRCGEPLRSILSSPELHPRLVNGSDYPVIAIDPTVNTRQLVSLGYLASEERAAIAEIFDANPLLFDFVLKRSLRVETDGATCRFAPEVFESARVFG